MEKLTKMIMKNRKTDHKMIAAFCVFTSVIFSVYYLLIVHGMEIGKYIISFIWKMPALAAGMWLVLETIQIIVKHVIKPFMLRRQYLKVYLLLCAGCVLLSFFGYIFWHIKNHAFFLTGHGMMKTVVTGLILFCVVYVSIVFGKKYTEHRTSAFCFNLSDLTIAGLCSIYLILSFFPVIMDYIRADFTYARIPNIFIDISYQQSGQEAVIGPITQEKVFCQSFQCSKENITSLTLMGATFARENSGHLIINLYAEDNDELLESWTMNLEDLKDNGKFTLDVKNPENQPDLTGKRCRLEIKSDSTTEDNAVTLYYVTEDRYADGGLMLNNENCGGDLILAVKGSGKPESFEKTRVWLCLYFAVFYQLVLLYGYRKWSHTSGEEGI